MVKIYFIRKYDREASKIQIIFWERGNNMNGISFYKEEIRDCNAVYFTEEFFNVKNDGSIDVSNELQNAIKTVVDKAGYGVLFIPEGEYLLSKTIYVPKAVRLIGYGDNRPHFILKIMQKDLMNHILRTRVDLNIYFGLLTN